jgi:S-DNA-T family DNA segregation ATPase FtsK/SpoIIIE|tara:strand:+ start:296 stop:2593 length:2298 start_codon:yes stop_codon:yes gene_type:complete
LFSRRKSNSSKKLSLSKKAPRDLASRVIREASWFSLLFIGLYIILALASYSGSDSSFSHSVDVGKNINNLAGVSGAYFSDFFLNIVGLSAWWLVFLSIYSIFLIYPRIENENYEIKHLLIIHYLGFLLLLLSSSTFEAGYAINFSAHLPSEQGGLLGNNIYGFLEKAMGYIGTLVFLVISFAIGFSLFTGWSWITISESIGNFICNLFKSIIEKFDDWKDRREGKKFEKQRTSFVESERRKLEDRLPVKILDVKSIAKESVRVKREKQTNLFTDSDSTLPPLHLLDQPTNEVSVQSAETIEFISRLIEKKLLDFGIEAKVISAQPGPVITRYEFEPAAGVKGSQVINLAKDLARALSVVSVRVVETIPGKTCMGLEIPNPDRQIVYFSEIVSSKIFADTSDLLAVALGKDISGKPAVADISKMPHILIAGTTGSGKSVAINALVLSLLYKATSDKVKMILIDPKMLELSVYEGIPHLLAPVVTDMRQAGNALNWCVAEMEKRYKLMSEFGVRNLAGFNQKLKESHEKGKPLTNPFSLDPESPEVLEELPLIVIVIDELADLMMTMGKKIEALIARLAQKARASGIHLVLATQRPSVDVITGLIKANIPARIGFQVSSKIDSRTILDQMGAEALLGKGDMLYMPPGTSYPDRIHGAFVSDREVHKVVSFLKSKAEPNYIEEILNPNDSANNILGESGPSGEKDPLYDEAVEIVLRTKKASISYVQRNLRIGYNRAARIIEDMEKAGLVTPMNNSGNREIIVNNKND